MKSSKLVQLLKILSESDLTRFSLYLASEFVYKRNDKILTLFKELENHYPKFETLKKEELLKKLFPNISMRVFNHTISDLTLILEDFLVHEELKKRGEDKQLVLMEIMNERGATKLLKQYANRLNKNIEKQPERDTNYYFNKLKIYHLLYFHPATQRLNKNAPDDLKALMENLDLFYFINKLKYGLEITNRIKYGSEKYTIHLLPIILKEIQKNDFYKNPLFEIYETFLKLLNQHDYTVYLKLKKLIYDNINIVSNKDKMILLQSLINYAVRELNVKNETYLNELFNHYEFGIKNEILIENQLIDEHIFNTILDIAFSLEKTEWAENFIKGYKQYLDKSIREDCINLANANLNFEKGEFNVTLNILSIYKYKDTYYSIRIRVLSLKTYYELLSKDESYFDKIEYDCDAFRNFLRRNSIDNISKKANQNFIKIITILSKYIYMKIGTKNKILKQLENMKLLASKTWLLKKIKVLK